MQIVIDIPEELKNKIDNSDEDNYRIYIWWFEMTLYCAIKNGTPLPKGHGRLIDEKEANALIAEGKNGKAYFGTVNKDWEVIDFLKTVPTIIEADKGGD